MHTSSDLVSEISAAWGWAGLEAAELISENEFGNLIVLDRAGRYWRMCPEDIYCEIVAWDRAAYEELVKQPDFIEDWQMEALVRVAREKLGDLALGQKYCLITPGILGGSYKAANIGTAPLIELIRFSGDLAQQLKDVPDGGEVTLKVVE